jgi:hypothetical protein
MLNSSLYEVSQQQGLHACCFLRSCTLQFIEKPRCKKKTELEISRKVSQDKSSKRAMKDIQSAAKCLIFRYRLLFFALYNRYEFWYKFDRRNGSVAICKPIKVLRGSNTGPEDCKALICVVNTGRPSAL